MGGMKSAKSMGVLWLLRNGYSAYPNLLPKCQNAILQNFEKTTDSRYDCAHKYLSSVYLSH